MGVGGGCLNGQLEVQQHGLGGDGHDEVVTACCIAESEHVVGMEGAESRSDSGGDSTVSKGPWHGPLGPGPRQRVVARAGIAKAGASGSPGAVSASSGHAVRRAQ